MANPKAATGSSLGEFVALMALMMSLVAGFALLGLGALGSSHARGGARRPASGGLSRKTPTSCRPCPHRC